MYIVAGVSGHTGRVVAETLLSRGEKVRVIVRSAEKGAPWQARGAEVAVASLGDEAALTRAFAGGKGAYVLAPPTPTSTDPAGEQRKVFAAVAGAARAAKLPHLVLLSSIGAQHPAGTGPVVGLHHGEQALAAATALTAVRAGYFLENWGAVLPMAKQDGVLPSFIAANTAVPTVATADIGRVAAAALLDGPRGRRVIELAGPVDVTAADVAAVLAERLGRPVRVQEAPLAAVVPTFTSFGLSAAMAGLYQEMYAAIASGKLAWEKAGESMRGSVSLEDGLASLL